MNNWIIVRIFVILSSDKSDFAFLNIFLKNQQTNKNQNKVKDTSIRKCGVENLKGSKNIWLWKGWQMFFSYYSFFLNFMKRDILFLFKSD